MDLTAYAEEMFAAATKDFPPEADQVPGDPVPDGRELTQALIDELFFDFEKKPVFEGTFHGPGPSFKMTDGQGSFPVHTWAFIESSGKSWLIPQWKNLNVPAEPFQGFAKEPEGEFVYLINYKKLLKSDDATTHDIAVYRKRI